MEKRTWDPPNEAKSCNANRAETCPLLTTLWAKRKKEELQPFGKSRLGSSLSQGCESLFGALKFLTSSSFWVPPCFPVPAVEAACGAPGLVTASQGSSFLALRMIYKKAGWSLALLPRLECSGMILAHCKQVQASRFKQFSCLSLPIEMAFCHIGQTGLELLTSGDLPTLASQSAGITDLSHCAQPKTYLFQICGVKLHRRQGLALLPRLECSDMVTAHCKPKLLGSSKPPTSASQVVGITGMHYHVWLIFFFCRTGVSLCCPGWSRIPGLKLSSCLGLEKWLVCSGEIMAHCSLDLLGSGDHLTSTSEVAGITDCKFYEGSYHVCLC
ncbi:hypothetical protein AAY473_033857 [Plecturocebus cupreus]